MVEDSGDVGVEEALPEEGGAEWGGEEAEEGSEQGRKFWWSHIDMKVCFSWLQLFVDCENDEECCFFYVAPADCVNWMLP